MAAPSGDQAKRRSRHSLRMTERMDSSDTRIATPPVSRMIRKTCTWPTFFATLSPVAIVLPGSKGEMSEAPVSNARTIGVLASDCTQTILGRRNR